MESTGKPILLLVLTPDGEVCRVECDSVRLPVPDPKNGGEPGGTVGIRRGHTDALVAVFPGKIEAFADGRPVVSCETGGGLAMVGGDRVTVLAQSVTRKE